MKKKQPKIICFIVFLLFSSISAQVTDKRVSKKVLSESGQPNLIVFSNKSSYKSSDSEKVFEDQLSLNNNQSFQKIKIDSDKEGFIHEKFQLYNQGIKVEFVNYNLHSKKGKLISMNGDYYNLENVIIKPTLSAKEAFNKAINHIGAKQYLWETPNDANAIGYKKPAGELVLLPLKGEQNKSKDKIRLAYKFDIYATNPLSRGDLYIDALTGEALFYNATIKHLGENNPKKPIHINPENHKEPFRYKMDYLSANAATRYSGTQTIQTALQEGFYILMDQTRGDGIQTYDCKGTATYPETNFTDADNNWTQAEYNNAQKDNGALDAHWGAEMTYDYFLKIHERNSFDNLGAKIKNYIHYSLIEGGYPTNENAFWNGSVMTYGDGKDAGGFDILTSLDIVAHEIGHAVCQNTAGLVYQYEPGAINEGFSDIWAACVEYYAAPSKSIWEIGNEVKPGGQNGIRSMSNPKLEEQPDTYGGTYWKDTEGYYPSSSNDYCGVHTNSGVLNHWFYILSVGKKGTNDIGDQYNVTGITIDKAAKIAYRLESIYLSPISTYADARTYAIQSAIDLYGDASPEVIATTNAFYAVGVGAMYGAAPPPQVPINLIPSGTTATTVSLSWTAPAFSETPIVRYNIYKGTIFIGSCTTTTYTVTGLDDNSNYSFHVVAKGNDGSTSAASNIVDVATKSEYCKSEGITENSNDVIGKVEFGTINNVSTETVGYENFLHISSDVNAGKKYTITITPSDVSRLPAEFGYGYAVFIDYNQDGSLDGYEETVWTKEPTRDAVVTGQITIPSKVAKNGITRMRIVMEYAEVPGACRFFDGGQVEDYTLNIINPNLIYCDSAGNNIDESIGQVKFGTINNTLEKKGDANGYEDFTDLSTDVAIGSNYPISITPIWKDANISNEGYSVFIDYNHNGFFSDVGETVWTNDPSITTPVLGNITIPATAMLGPTRMRVSMRYKAIPGPCDYFYFGQVQDYSVNVTATLSTPNLNKTDEISDFELYPNPVDNELNISLPEKDPFIFKIINALGQQVATGNLSKGCSINVSQLSSGIYTLKLSNGKQRIAKKFIKK
ncbi:M4 family metallopeptidase [Flavobacterium sp. Fl-318]|uniref:M4 family metallopeptidase n=1 Tax=Flavobacterium cupriresistens TaxID=2893885 RepID=A0ABU4R8P0_9FLAO|nr:MULTISPECIES: M4 family metallopeptidase [unclassified Flavobacterium]MDX6188946.1 M4 family metallopeptidase [Flavobacterium sp. Fl-318]UFH44273.1 M4 family metallopeptidase [Flavobacterium sp. F-323]